MHIVFSCVYMAIGAELQKGARQLVGHQGGVFKREIMMATGPRAARERTSTGESVGCMGLAGRRLVPSFLVYSGDQDYKM
jgi:hypothetical protein